MERQVGDELPGFKGRRLAAGPVSCEIQASSGRALTGTRHRSRNICRPAVSMRPECIRIGPRPVGPFGPSPTVPVEMPSHSADTVACLGTVTATVMTRG